MGKTKPSERVSRLIAAYDIHVGHERANVGGRDELTLRNLHDGQALDAMFQFAADFKPTVFILGGDQLDCGCVAHWNKSSPRKVEGIRLKDELDLLDSLVVRRVDAIVKPIKDAAWPKPRKIWLRGNHERFLNDVLDQNPALTGIASIEGYLKLRDRGWEIYDFGEAARVGKTWWIHGEHVGSAQYGAKRAVELYGRNVRFGHHHSHNVHIKTSPVMEDDFHSGVMVPCLCRKNPGYAKNRPNNWVLGFTTAEFHSCGIFNTHTHLMVNGRFIANGKLYVGRKGAG